MKKESDKGYVSGILTHDFCSTLIYPDHAVGEKGETANAISFGIGHYKKRRLQRIINEIKTMANGCERFTKHITAKL